MKGQTTVFVSTHILADVERVCDRVAIINKGKMVTTGSIDELRSQRQQRPALSWSSRQIRVPWLSSSRDCPGLAPWRARIGVSGTCCEWTSPTLTWPKRELPRLVYESGLTLLRFELAEASLEDVFMELVGEEEASG